MPNYGAKIVNNAISSLVAQQAVIAATSNNIANVNTPGYSKRGIELEDRIAQAGTGLAAIGNGVQVGGVRREADSFLERALQAAGSAKLAADTDSTYLGRLTAIFDLSGTGGTIGTALSNFYNATADVASSPSSIEYRTAFIESANDLVNALKVGYNTVADLQKEIDERIDKEVDTVNTIAAQIADLNDKVAQRESTGGVAADERDKRDLLLRQLGEKLSFSTTDVSDGTINVILPDGFALVSGTRSRPIETTVNPSFTSGSQPPSLSGGVLSSIVYDYDTTSTGSNHVDLTQAMQSGDGSIGALLRLRGFNASTNTSAFQADGSLVAIASRIEGISRYLLTTVNQAYLGADEDGATVGLQPSAGDLDDNSPSVYGLFTFSFAGTRDDDGDGTPDDLDSATLNIDNYSSILSVAITDAREIAAALDSNPATGATTFADGDGANMANLVTLLKSPGTYSSGSHTFTGTLDQAYAEGVTHFGNLQSNAEINRDVAESNYQAALTRRDEVSGVSLDEEFANLIKFQKAFQASARMIKLADTLLEQIVGLI